MLTDPSNPIEEKNYSNFVFSNGYIMDRSTLNEMMSKHPFYSYLKQRLGGSLPGPSAQQKMSPVPIDSDFGFPDQPTHRTHPSGVLVPLFPDQEQKLHVILTLRTDKIRHAGQISFPGGRQEVNETLCETAIRESEEEIGLNRRDLTIAGKLTPLYLHRTENQITPFIGFLQHKPAMTRNPNEVEEILTVSLDHLNSEKDLVRERWDLREQALEVPYWDIHKVPLWGATAMMMSELLELYREFLNGSSLATGRVKRY